VTVDDLGHAQASREHSSACPSLGSPTTDHLAGRYASPMRGRAGGGSSASSRPERGDTSWGCSRHPPAPPQTGPVDDECLGRRCPRRPRHFATGVPAFRQDPDRYVAGIEPASCGSNQSEPVVGDCPRQGVQVPPRTPGDRRASTPGASTLPGRHDRVRGGSPSFREPDELPVWTAANAGARRRTASTGNHNCNQLVSGRSRPCWPRRAAPPRRARGCPVGGSGPG
jgi:hypothetical protein